MHDLRPVCQTATRLFTAEAGIEREASLPPACHGQCQADSVNGIWGHHLWGDGDSNALIRTHISADAC